MKPLSTRAFTLIEMLTVMLIIAILAALILGVHGYVAAKAARSKAEGEIQGISAACEAYKADNGSYPRVAAGGSALDSSAATEGTVSGTAGNLMQAKPPISPMTDGDPTATKYQNASRWLYEQLSGDYNFNGVHDSTGDGTTYLPFKPDQLGRPPGTTSSTVNPAVAYLQDPYGNSYGYSTAAATDEECYQQNLASNASAPRPAAKGFNPTFDLWSTGGRVTAGSLPTGTANDGSASDPNTVWARWIKNW